MQDFRYFIAECAQSMNEAFFGRQVDLRRPTAIGDFRQTRFEGVSALDLVCEYIHNNLLNLQRDNLALTYASLERPTFARKSWHFMIRTPGNPGLCVVEVLPERRISKDEAFSVVMSDEFDEKLHDLLRNAVYSEKKRDYKYLAYDGRARSSDSGTFMASVANFQDRRFSINLGDAQVEVRLGFADFSVSSTVRDDVLDQDDDRPRANVGHVDGGVYRQLDRYSFSNTRPNIPA